MKTQNDKTTSENRPVAKQLFLRVFLPRLIRGCVTGAAVLTSGTILLILMLWKLGIIEVEHPPRVARFQLGILAAQLALVGGVLGVFAAVISSFTRSRIGTLRCFAIVFFVATLGATITSPVKFGTSNQFAIAFISYAILGGIGILLVSINSQAHNVAENEREPQAGENICG